MSTIHTTSEQSDAIYIQTLGRCGNYYFAEGWHTRPHPTKGKFVYKFASSGKHMSPDICLSRTESSHSTATLSDGAHRFLHLFRSLDKDLWTENSPNHVELSILDSAGQTLASATCASVTPYDQQSFYQFLLESGHDDVWNNQAILRTVASMDLGEQYTHFRKLADTMGWVGANAILQKHIAGLNTQTASHLKILFYVDWAEVSDVAYMPPALKDAFLAALEGFDCAGLYHESAAKTIAQLARFDLDAACRFAVDVIHAQKPSRADLAKLIHNCLPHHSQWWIHHTLVNSQLGDEQVADALNVAGYAAAGQQSFELAILCYKAALQVKGDTQSAAWNLAWLHAENTNADTKQISHAFCSVNRHYPKLSLCTAWPVVSDSLWPAAPLTKILFTLPPGVQTWPRISIITPSYNQGHYIEETILSILHQNYPNLQYIVIDGSSTDDTRAVLERYRDRIDHLVIEPDNGQTEAINKGLRLADGEIIAWLNSDDMYAPGALHAAALAWLANDADVIAGQCIEHIDRRLLLINKPAARNLDFNPPQLARIFKYWLKGFYFYQPEVFFTKRILDEVGLLDESLYYSMDYDLWMRFAKANARLEVINWPIAFFRKHDAQKTSNLIDCIEEQARVRTKHYKLEVPEERRCQILRSLAELRDRRQITVGIITKRIKKIFSTNTQAELDAYVDPNFKCVLTDDEFDPGIAEADLIILLVHVLDDIRTIKHLRMSRPDRPVVGWFWDNHHHLFENYAVAEALDLVIPGHALYAEYLRNDHSLLSEHVPLCVTQWARHDIAEWFSSSKNGKRDPALYGGFVAYHFEPKRTEFLHKVMESMPGHALGILPEDNLKVYFGRSEEERFAEWCSYQTSLVLPLRNDLSQRVFDALLAGQIPLVPNEIKDLDLVIPPALQESLPIVRFSMKSVQSCLDAHQKALEHFTREGKKGALRRHQYALENHTFSSMISRIISTTIDTNRCS